MAHQIAEIGMHQIEIAEIETSKYAHSSDFKQRWTDSKSATAVSTVTYSRPA